MRCRHQTFVPLFLGLSAACQGAAPTAVTAEDYARAERFILGNARHYILNGDVRHAWLEDGERLYYRRDTRGGKEFLLVDASRASRAPAFDHEALARALAGASGLTVEGRNLPFDWFEFRDGGRAIELEAGGRWWRCVLGGNCSQMDRRDAPEEARSPDGRWALVRKGYDVWLRSLTDGTERQITTDGVQRFSYGGQDGLMQFRKLEPSRTVALWSPDSRRVAFEKVDDRGVLDMYFLQQVPEDGTVRPILYKEPVAFPGEPHKGHVDTVIILDVASGERTDVRHPSFLAGIGSIILDDDMFWSPDGGTLFLTPNEEGRKTLRLLAVDAGTGELRQVIEESSDTYLDGGATLFGSRGPNFLRTGEIIWYSERDDWGHLYLYDRDGKLKNRITRGAWKVRDVVRVDERRRQVYFTANGREAGEDPYQRHLYVAHLDGTGLRLLTPENADHDVDVDLGFSPSGRHFVEIHSRPDRVPETVLRARDGRVVMKLEMADISQLQAEGYTMPEPFEVTAADGKTRIYGTIFRPGRLDPAKRYPVVDIIYPGPQRIQTVKSYMRTPSTHGMAELGFMQSLAELGFIVVTIDGRGTPLRSKSFHDIAYGNMQQAGNIDDHIAGLRELAGRYPYMDLNRVGVYGHSSGGFATVRAMLDHPEFYKVGISSAGDHDQRGDDLGWATTYQGPYSPALWEPTINARLVDRLAGKLLLVQGDMDQAVHSAVTMQLVDALIKANKDFDLLLVPNAGHEVDRHTYVIRRRWDYFVRHLLGAEPPHDYRIGTPQGY
jgi:dipeptidyl-peptidase-4